MFNFLKKERLIDNEKTRENLKYYGLLTDKLKVKTVLKKYNIKNLNFVKTINDYDTFDDISFNNLENIFVLKCNHDSGSSKVIKKEIFIKDYEKLKQYYNKRLTNIYSNGAEPHYKYIKPKLLMEEYIDLKNYYTEYKFHCIYNDIVCLTTITNKNNKKFRKTYNKNFEPLNFNQVGSTSLITPKPDNYDDIITVVLDILKNINVSYVRVDLYNVNNKIYFGELTFTPGGLGSQFTNKKFDILMLDFLNKKYVNQNEINNFLDLKNDVN